MELRVPRLGSNEDGNVRVGLFPQQATANFLDKLQVGNTFGDGKLFSIFTFLEGERESAASDGLVSPEFSDRAKNGSRLVPSIRWGRRFPGQSFHDL